MAAERRRDVRGLLSVRSEETVCLRVPAETVTPGFSQGLIARQRLSEVNVFRMLPSRGSCPQALDGEMVLRDWMKPPAVTVHKSQTDLEQLYSSRLWFLMVLYLSFNQTEVFPTFYP